MYRKEALLILCLLCFSCRGAEFSGERALDYTRQVVAFGERDPGSEGHRKAQAWIREQLSQSGCEVSEDRFHAETPRGPIEMSNLICRFPGSSGRAVVFSGHYDTKWMPGSRFVGANDAGSSTGLLLGLAHSLAGKKRVHDVYLVFFDGEEAFINYTDADGFYGSRHLAQRWAAEGLLSKIVALINVDMIGDVDLAITRESTSDRRLVDLIWSVARDLGYSRHFSNQQGSVLDDHVAFLRRGVPAVDLIDFDYGPGNSWWHTPADTMDKLSARSLEAVGSVLLEVLDRLEAQ